MIKLTPELQALVEKHIPLAVRIAKSFGSDDEFESEAYLGLVQAATSYDGSIPFRAWAARIVRQYLIRFKYRHRLKQPTNFSQGFVGKGQARLTAPPMSNYEELESYIFDLPEHLREISVNRWVDKMPLKDVAAKHNMRVKDVKLVLAESAEIIQKNLDDSLYLSNGETE